MRKRSFGRCLLLAKSSAVLVGHLPTEDAIPPEHQAVLCNSWLFNGLFHIPFTKAGCQSLLDTLPHCRKQVALAADLVDGLYAAMMHDPVGDGRIVAATWANSLLGYALLLDTSETAVP